MYVSGSRATIGAVAPGRKAVELVIEDEEGQPWAPSQLRLRGVKCLYVPSLELPSWALPSWVTA